MQRFDSLQEEYVASVPFRVDVRKMYRVEEFPVDWRGGGPDQTSPPPFKGSPE